MSKENPIIMVVEHDDLLLQAITAKMNDMGVETVSCKAGGQVLDYLQNMAETPDALWLDYSLGGGMNVLDIVRKMKVNPAWKNIPIIIVSNTASDDNVQNMLALGVSKYLLKTEYRLDAMIDVLKDFIAQSDQSK